MAKRKSKFTVENVITYSGGIHPKVDAVLEKEAKKLGGVRGSSGCCTFGDCERDIQFLFTDTKSAEKFSKRVDTISKKWQKMLKKEIEQ